MVHKSKFKFSFKKNKIPIVKFIRTYQFFICQLLKLYSMVHGKQWSLSEL